MRLNPNINLGRMKVFSLLTWILKVALSLLMLFSFFKKITFLLSFILDRFYCYTCKFIISLSVANLPLILFSIFFISPFVGFHF